MVCDIDCVADYKQDAPIDFSAVDIEIGAPVRRSGAGAPSP